MREKSFILRDMQKIKVIFTMVLIMAAMVMVGCEGGDTNTNGGTPVIMLDRTQLNVDGNGGDMVIYYSVDNAVKGVGIKVSSRVDWVEVKSTKDSRIVLAVAKNTSINARETIVTVDYEGMERSVFITINQDKAILDMFSFEVTDVTYMGCKVRYTPVDDSMQYMANIIDKEYFTYSGVDTEEAFIQAEMDNYLKTAEYYQVTLEELMDMLTPQLIYTGETVREFANMQHSGKYVIYSYGVNFSGNEYEVTTPIHHTIIELPMPSMYDVTFNLVATWTSSGATLSITPENWDGYYNIQIAPSDSLYYAPEGEALSELTIRSLANAFYKSARSAIAQGTTPEKFLASTCYKGYNQLPLAIERGRKYMIIVFAVESEEGAIPVMRSIPSVTYLH